MRAEEQRLGRMNRIDLRKVWRHEADQFTPWLARHIELLADALGLTDDLEVVETEKTVGSYRADILCESVARNVVLVECQLGDTDHPHLGQIIAYGAGVEASTVVWIAKRFRPEHRAALDWLNAATDEIDFFGLELELWRIGDSDPAPKFNVVAKPNDWSRSTVRNARRAEPTAIDNLKLDYWTAFHGVLEASGGPAKPQSPSRRQWMNMAVGKTGFHLAAVISTFHNVRIRAELVISKNDVADGYLDALKAQKAEIEAELEFQMDWEASEGEKARIAVYGSFDPKDRSTWTEQHAWLVDRLNRMHTVLSPRIKKLKPAQAPAS